LRLTLHGYGEQLKGEDDNGKDRSI
jgi:hypothetical protein